MADFLESVLSEAEPEAPAVEPVAPEPVIEQPVEPQVEPEAPAVETVTEPSKPEPGYVPISALMDERDKRKAAEARAAANAPQPQQVQAPDPLDDPVAYNAYLEQRLEARVAQERFTMSDVMAKQTHGEDTVNAAIEWANQKVQNDPSFAMSYMREGHPIDWIVRQHKRDADYQALGGMSVHEFVEQEVAKRLANTQSAPIAAAPIQAAVPPAPRPAAPPRSIASDVSMSAPVVTDATAEFEAIFKKG